jgi:hypothetical protein
MENTVGNLIPYAKESLADLLNFDKIKIEQWFMRVSVSGKAELWELLTSDSKENNKIIKKRIEENKISELTLAYVVSIRKHSQS